MLPTSMLAASTKRRAEADSLGDIAYHRIKEKIISLELPPASVLDESQLVDELQVGLTPVRQALRRLSIENLVVILPRRGTIVADLNISDLHKIFELRIEIETLAAKFAAERATEKQIDELDALIEQSEMLIQKGDNTQLMKADREIHMLIAEAANNEFLAETAERLYGHVQRLWNLSIAEITGLAQGFQEHKAMVKAIRQRDSEEASMLMRKHVSHFQEEINKVL